KAAQVQAQITFSGYSPTVGITSADLCTVFANAIDNAIEACAKDESDTEKQIEIRSDFQQGFYQLRITNPVFEKVEIRHGNQIRTSKEDASLHGFGVANIVRTAQKYGGDAVMTAENGLFALEVSLWLKQEA
ncbi:MAG: ATP-binding protein, partial [Oscillospiraceae bacterium]|nr:ATP-binding protein [Oscillospiraceae bacterium]